MVELPELPARAPFAHDPHEEEFEAQWLEDLLGFSSAVEEQCLMSRANAIKSKRH